MRAWIRESLVEQGSGGRIQRHLLIEEGEEVIDEVRHHSVVYGTPMLEGCVAVALFVLFAYSRVDVAWLPLLLGWAVLGHAVWRTLEQHRDVFVITNMRVFRVQGVIAERLATMPIARILDITVEKPLMGRLFGYGHFVFESAAQEQGLRDIRYVGRPYERDLTIQRVINRAGLRGPRPGQGPHGAHGSRQGM